jgi:hypothetical protein
MKTWKQEVRCVIVTSVFILPAISGFAVDGLQIQTHQETNVMLRWPSIPGQTFLVLHTTNLNEPVTWTVLESGYPAAEATNETVFTHAGQLPRPREWSGGERWDAGQPVAQEIQCRACAIRADGNGLGRRVQARAVEVVSARM